ncbi:hypothetical protein SAICODRAFT_69103 [Saitoella complicata NRRL Y-17804]|nr:uncharacterized protein SAICODRAFT_69103 [Saitoella complicata NRRL Y-17804]ODQ55780.1 hypothetical protein SAICODRAFT_69103 [Saitoella complicata NRRL Y-17804]
MSSFPTPIPPPRPPPRKVDPIHRRRTAEACDRCKRRKTKCDGSQPCVQCQSQNAECVYTGSSRSRQGRGGSTSESPVSTPGTSAGASASASATMSSSASGSGAGRPTSSGRPHPFYGTAPPEAQGQGQSAPAPPQRPLVGPGGMMPIGGDIDPLARSSSFFGGGGQQGGQSGSGGGGGGGMIPGLSPWGRSVLPLELTFPQMGQQQQQQDTRFERFMRTERSEEEQMPDVPEVQGDETRPRAAMANEPKEFFPAATREHSRTEAEGEEEQGGEGEGTGVRETQQKEGEVENLVNVTSRLVLDSKGKARFLGESSPLAFLGSVRKDVERRYGPSSFTRDTAQNVISDGVSLPGRPIPFQAQLPSRQVADVLVEAFFKHVHNLQPVFSRDGFWKKYEDMWKDPNSMGRVWFCHMNLILALGCLFKDPTPGLDADGIKEEGKQTAERAVLFYETARTLMDEVYESGEFHCVQASILAALYLITAGQRNGCWTFVGIAIRVAQGFGLHRKAGSESLQDDGIDGANPEMRKRVWWTLYALETYIASTLGRPIAIRYEDCDVEWPVVPESPNGDAIEPEPLRSLFILHTAKLATVVSEIMRRVYPARHTESMMDVIKDIAGHIRKYSTELPEELRPVNHRCGGVREEDMPMRMVCQLQLERFWAIMLLTRPAFFRYVGEGGKRAELKEYAHSCVFVARKYIELAWDQHARDLIHRRQFYIVQVLFAASVITLFDLSVRIIRCPEAEAESILAIVDRATGLMRYCGEWDVIAWKALGIVERFRDALVAIRARKRGRPGSSESSGSGSSEQKRKGTGPPEKTQKGGTGPGGSGGPAETAQWQQRFPEAAAGSDTGGNGNAGEHRRWRSREAPHSPRSHRHYTYTHRQEPSTGSNASAYTTTSTASTRSSASASTTGRAAGNGTASIAPWDKKHGVNLQYASHAWNSPELEPYLHLPTTINNDNPEVALSVGSSGPETGTAVSPQTLPEILAALNLTTWFPELHGMEYDRIYARYNDRDPNLQRMQGGWEGDVDVDMEMDMEESEAEERERAREVEVFHRMMEEFERGEGPRGQGGEEGVGMGVGIGSEFQGPLGLAQSLGWA